MKPSFVIHGFTLLELLVVIAIIAIPAAQLAENNDAFVADANTPLKGALTKTQFDAASTVIKKRLIGGYNETFLGELNQRGYQVFLYRLRPKDGGDDLLGTLSLKNDKVAGINFR